MKRFITSTFLLLSLTGFAFSEVKSKTSIKLNSNITSRHYWRGIMVSNSANYEGDLVLTTGNFNFGAWGGYAFNNEYSEFDFHFGYKLSERLSVELWDLYASRDRASIDEYDYFDLRKETTNHLLDASIHFKCGEKFPLTISWSSLIWGRDLDQHKNQNYSSYLGLDYPVRIRDIKIKFNLGLNVFENSLYGEHTNIVDLGLTASRNLKVNTELQIPIWAKLAINPEAETANLIVGFSF